MSWIFFVESFKPEKYPLLVQTIKIQPHPEDPLEKMLLFFSEQIIQYQHSVHRRNEESSIISHTW